MNQFHLMKTILPTSFQISKRLRPAWKTVALCVCSFSVLAVRAQPLISNTYQTPYGLVPDVFLDQWVAAPFQTGPNPSLVSSVSLYEWTFSTYGQPDGLFSVSIYNDVDGKPGSLISGGALAGPSKPAGASYQTYSASQPLSLAANSRYWVVAASSGGDPFDTYAWAAATTTGYASTAGWSFFNYFDSTHDQGATWDTSDLGPGIGPQLLAINGVVVPEPSAAALVAMPVLLLLAYRNPRGRLA